MLLQAIHEAVQIEGTFEVLNTNTAQAPWLKEIYKVLAKTRGHEEHHPTRTHQSRETKTPHEAYTHMYLMAAAQNAYATVEKTLSCPEGWMQNGIPKAFRMKEGVRVVTLSGTFYVCLYFTFYFPFLP